ncbi:hypothetical protein FQN57_000885 [Myotisia sp. PD_48]|nr:hypothetical protein FQN57_000885 [Myotisia sp. PD_48]
MEESAQAGRSHKDWVSSDQLDGEVVPEFYFAEHRALGDSVILTFDAKNSDLAKNFPLILPNGLKLTYGEINGLAGDLYGTITPISDGKTETERQALFNQAFDSLAKDTKYAPVEVLEFLQIFQQELEAVDTAIRIGVPPSKAYAKAGDVTDRRLALATLNRQSGLPSYLDLALVNFDHFGEDAEIAYNAGHAAAIQYALRDDCALPVAYAMDAFAAHFLQDRFSAGHLRVPRRLLHGGLLSIADYCCRLMHDEEGDIGLSVSNLNGDTWEMRGDTSIFDDVSRQNRDICLKAIQASVDEVYHAWRDKTKPNSYKAWTYAPTLESAQKGQRFAPLFTVSSTNNTNKPTLLRRKDISDRTQFVYIPNWTYFGTALKCKLNGL